MSNYRFLSDCDTPDVFFATVVTAASRAKAQDIMKNRLTADETVVSVNVLENGRWLVLEGQAVPAEHVKKHSKMRPGVQVGGAAILENSADAPLPAHPEKAGGTIRAQASSAFAEPPSNFAVSPPNADDEPPIVKVMWALTALVALSGMIIAGALSSGIYNDAAKLYVWTVSMLPTLGAVLATFTMKYLAGIYLTLRRMEANGTKVIGPSIHS